MATFYLDPVSGNDANDGTTFANRWQSLTNGATAARIAPGDEIRVIASPDPVDSGMTATWSNFRAVTSASPWVTLYSSGAWTQASTNVTISTSTNRKLGSNTVSIAVGAAFTTGKAAWLNLFSTNNLTDYQQVTFWIQMTAGTMNADNDVSIALCSDTGGDVIVHTIPVPRIYSTGRWVAVTFDTGAALASNIRSVAFYVNSDLGAQTFLINDITVIKAPSAVDSISLNSLIGPSSTGPWYTIQSINGTSLVLEPDTTSNQPAAANILPCSYTTGTEPVWKLEPIILPTALRSASGNNFGTVNDSGLASVNRSSAISITGGWNRTNMSTQTGETYISAAGGSAAGISATSRSWITVSKISLIRFGNALFVDGTCNKWLISDMDILGSSSSPLLATFQASSINIRRCIGSTTLSLASNVCSSNTYTIGTISVTGFGLGASSLCTVNIGQMQTVGTNTSYVNLIGFANGGSNNVVNVGRIGGVGGGSVFSNNIINNAGGDFTTNNTVRFTDTVTVSSQATNSLVSTTNGSGLKIFCNGQSISARQFVFVSQTAANSTGNIIYDAPAGTASLSGSSDVTFFNSSFSAPVFATNSTGFVRHANVSGSPTDQRTTYPSTFGSITTDTTIRRTPSGVSWKMNIANSGVAISPTEGVPLSLPVAKIAVNASTLVTASVWVYRTNSNLAAKLVCPGDQIGGVPNDVVAIASGAINTWEQLTITFTPTQAGVVALEVDCYGDETTGNTGITGDVYVDDFEATQA